MSFPAVLAAVGCLVGIYLFSRPTRSLPRRVVVFSRYPSAGTTKTRLIPKLGSFGAALAQRHMTEKILTTANTLRETIADVELRYWGGTKRLVRTWLKCLGIRGICRQQAKGDLGFKMASAFKDAFREGASWVIIVGSDIPGISREIIGESFEKLRENGMVLGAALDGGYYLVGLSKDVSNCVENVEDLFCGAGIEWGTSAVFAQQWRRAKELGVSVGKLSTSLSDVDFPRDLSVFDRDLGTVVWRDLVSPSWSIIVPTLNESHQIESTLRNCIENANRSNRLEIIIVDGGSTDSTIDIVEKFAKGAENVSIKVIRSEPGRGKQLHNGVINSTNENLLFLHADTRLPQGYDATAFETLATPGVKLGAFRFNLDALQENKTMEWWLRLRLQMVQWGTRHRSEKALLPYGDQAYFIRRKDYDDVGGFKPVPLMEDYEFLLRVRSVAKERVRIADGPGTTTSARRWLNRGYIRTTGFNTFILAAYHCGVSPETLARWYYGNARYR